MENMSLTLFFVLCLSNVISGISVQVVKPPYEYETRYYEQKLDHFDFENNQTYTEKYLISDAYWKPNGGPIFFYPGNEGSVEDFAQNTGLMWEWAPHFGALVVFAEHRYYGDSSPTGNASDPTYYGYLNTVQVLADFAFLLTNLKETIPGAKKAPVVAFGGSYGAMLAAWMRLKYPNIIQMALAASAPLYLVSKPDACDSFSRITTDDFRRASPQCPKSIRRSWDVINSFNTTEGRAFLSETFKLCNALNSTDDVTNFKQGLAAVYGNTAMVDYPSANSFIMPVPAWPVQNMCSYLNDSDVDDQQLMKDIAKAISVYMNYTGNASCLDLSLVNGDAIDNEPWDYQCCTELVIPECTNGVQDMFEPSPWDFDEFAAECNESFGVIPDPSFVQIMYSGVVDSSRIIFSNGNLDPWSGGGIQRSLSSSLVAVHISQAAHHLDLRPTSSDDPASVIEARNTEKYYINKWLDEYWHREEGPDGDYLFAQMKCRRRRIKFSGFQDMQVHF